MLDDTSDSDTTFIDDIDVVTDGTLDDMFAITESGTITAEAIITADALS